ncbi:MAG: hypothetical protein DSY77_06335 [Bacteroidetes bacterium]|nr:MAG: hypothetical protein DSY77_06335 [Bacteroidota bacterium]
MLQGHFILNFKIMFFRNKRFKWVFLLLVLMVVSLVFCDTYLMEKKFSMLDNTYDYISIIIR